MKRYLIILLVIFSSCAVWHDVEYKQEELSRYSIRKIKVRYEGKLAYIKEYNCFADRVEITDTISETDSSYYFYRTKFPKYKGANKEIFLNGLKFELSHLHERYDTVINGVECKCAVYYLKMIDETSINWMDRMIYFDIDKKIVVNQKEFYNKKFPQHNASIIKYK